VAVGIAYQIGPFFLDPRAKQLMLGGVPVSLGARGVALLTILVEHKENYIPKAELMDRAWPRIVGNNNLAVQIAAIRRALAQAGGEGWIQTLPRRGYRFVGPLAQLPHSAPPAGLRLSNLQSSLSSFIGRDSERAAIRLLLHESRLVTLVGAGGIGKSRLALQVATEVEPTYADGVWLVELGALTDAARVPAAVAQVLGVNERDGQSLAETLCAWLRLRRLLLILDNCEHLRDAARSLAEALLQGAPQTTIVATSREPLQADGEVVYAVSSLTLPHSQALAPEVAQSDAVRLFVARAAQQRPEFTLDGCAATVAAICIRLDGMPLALELAAARVRSLSVEQIAARLDDRFRLLATGNRAVPRHQTLRAAIEWSFDLLAEDERRVLRRVAVFAGGFSREAAMAVASEATLDEVAVADVLEQLVRRSLVVAESPSDTVRYRLLETTRAYALEKLEEAGESAALKRRHARHFCDRFATAFTEWFESPDGAWWSTYVPEHENVRAALDWAFGETGDAALGIALAGTCGELWKHYSARREGRQWIEKALTRVDERTPVRHQALLWSQRGMAWDVHEPEAFFSALEHGGELFRQCEDRIGRVYVETFRGHMLAVMGRRDAAEQVLADIAPLIDEGLAPRLRASYLDAASLTALLRGDPAAARARQEQALALCRSMGADRLAIIQLSNLADLTWQGGDLEEAEERLREALALASRLPFIGEDALSSCRLNLIGVLVEKGEIDEALQLARAAVPFRVEHNVAWQTMDHMALRAALAGRYDAAARLAGYTDARYADKGLPRQPNEQRARARAEELLGQRYSAEELPALLAAGAALTDAGACELALQS